MSQEIARSTFLTFELREIVRLNEIKIPMFAKAYRAYKKRADRVYRLYEINLNTEANALVLLDLSTKMLNLKTAIKEMAISTISAKAQLKELEA